MNTLAVRNQKYKTTLKIAIDVWFWLWESSHLPESGGEKLKFWKNSGNFSSLKLQHFWQWKVSHCHSGEPSSISNSLPFIPKPTGTEVLPAQPLGKRCSLLNRAPSNWINFLLQVIAQCSAIRQLNQEQSWWNPDFSLTRKDGVLVGRVKQKAAGCR